MERSKMLGSLGGCYWLVVPKFFLNRWCQSSPRRGLEASPAVSVFSPTVHDDLGVRPDHWDPPLTPLATGCQGWVLPHPSSPTSGEESGCFSGPQRFFSLWTQINIHCFLLDSCGFCHRLPQMECLRQNNCALLQFWRSDVWARLHWAKVRVLR